MPRPRPLPLLLASLAVATVAACSHDDGRTLPLPDPATTTSTTAPPTLDSAAPGDGAVEVFTLYSSAIPEGSEVPTRFTCDGADVSPPLEWVAAPAAAELAVVVRDRDAGGFVHWVLTGIDPAVQGFGEGGIPEGAVEATNGFGTVGWRGPCPPGGDGPHTYAVALHALPEPLVLAPGTPGEEAAALVEGASSASATLTFVKS